jgi:hypothetical protein
VQEILEREDATRLLYLYEMLGQDASFREGMGQNFELLHAIIRRTTHPEG